MQRRRLPRGLLGTGHRTPGLNQALLVAPEPLSALGNQFARRFYATFKTHQSQTLEFGPGSKQLRN